MNAKTRAILSVLFTIFIAIVGFSNYSSGSGYMTFFGIELSSGMFFLLIAVFVIFDIISIVNAFKADKQIQEEVAQDVQAFSEDKEALEAPCSVSITRLSSMLGAANKVNAVLNGVEVGTLKNGQTLETTTSFRQNKLLMVFTNDNQTRSLEFEAESNGHVRITLNYAKGLLYLD